MQKLWKKLKIRYSMVKPMENDNRWIHYRGELNIVPLIDGDLETTAIHVLKTSGLRFKANIYGTARNQLLSELENQYVVVENKLFAMTRSMVALELEIHEAKAGKAPGSIEFEIRYFDDEDDCFENSLQDAVINAIEAGG